MGRRDRIATYLVAPLATAVVCLALSSTGAGPAAVAAATSSPGVALTLQGNGSVDEAWLTGANPGDQITLMQHGSAVVVSGNPALPTRSGR